MGFVLNSYKLQVTSDKVKRLLVQKTDWNNPKAKEVSLQFDKMNVPFSCIDTLNWANYSYCPKVSFRIAHNGKALLLNYIVNESDIKAIYNRNNGRIRKDSCLEFFISFSEDSYCYIEFNCIGKLLIRKGLGRGENRIKSSESLLKCIDRWSSLGDLLVENRSSNWGLSLIIPNKIFYPEITGKLKNIKTKGTFCKFGYCLQTAHFI